MSAPRAEPALIVPVIAKTMVMIRAGRPKSIMAIVIKENGSSA